MLKYILLLFCMILSSVSFASDPEGHEIKVTIKGFKPGTTGMLGHYYADSKRVADSAKVDEDGKMIFKGKDKYPQGFYFIYQGGKMYFEFLMDSNQHFSMELDTVDYINSIKIKGSEENTTLFNYQRFISAKGKIAKPIQQELRKTKNKDSIKILTEKITAIDKEVKEYMDGIIKNSSTSFVSKFIKATKEIDTPEAPILSNGKKDSLFSFYYYKSHFFDNIDFTDERILYTPIFHPKIKQYLDNLTSPIPDSLSAASDYLIEKARGNTELFKYMVYWLTYHFESSKTMGHDAIFVHLVKKYYVTHQAYWVDSAQLDKIEQRAAILDYTLIGKKAPPISMLDSVNKPVSLYDIKGLYTVVIFWDEGCGHCKKEVPKLKELYENKLKAMGIRVFAIAAEEKPAAWKKFIIENKLNWINVHQPDDYKLAVTKKIYDIQTTPYLYLLDENKVIKAKHFDVEQLGPLLDALEKERKEKVAK
ncbi:MAG TPA: redoxin domain-containing protein [Bacteroidia bacterium]|nr:redoxin domain-containing protein [Bacteroidia bacterium]HRG51353.1 redoxin domain-containing protein [Bacteroidia bacterium]